MTAEPAAQAAEYRAPEHRTRGGTDGRVPWWATRRAVLAAAAVLLLSLAAFCALWQLLPLPLADVSVYRAEGRAVLDGTNLYGFTVTEWELPATYPPFAALLFVPAALLPLPAAQLAFVVGNALLLALLLHLSLRAAGLPRRYASAPVRAGTVRAGTVFAAPVLAGTAAALWLEPVFQTFAFGQINLFLACLVLWDLGRPDGARGKGLAIGVAAGIKLTPAIFAVHLLLTGRVRAALTAGAGFAGTVALGGLLLPGATFDFFTHRVFATGRVGKAWIVDNQSLQGLVARVTHTAEPGLLWLLPAVAVGVVGLLVARHLSVRHGQDAWGVQLTAVTALLVSPISWSHHWVWCVPLLALTAARGGGYRWAAAGLAVLFTARSMWLLPKEGDLDLRLAWWQQPLASPYPLLGLALLAAVPLLVRRRREARRGRRQSVPVPVSGSASDSTASDSTADSRSCESTIR